jgi:hypothetical protein
MISHQGSPDYSVWRGGGGKQAVAGMERLVIIFLALVHARGCPPGVLPQEGVRE